MLKEKSAPTPWMPLTDIHFAVHPLTNGDESEVLAFLDARPLHTVIMVGFIRDNGLVSPLNRGRFYAYRNRQGELDGVALIGHATLIEARNEAALAAFARLAYNCPHARLIVGQKQRIQRFWNFYSQEGVVPHQLCSELLLEQRWPIKVHERVPGLRLATPDDIEQAAAVHAQMAFAETGINPLEKDAQGFCSRVARRIEQKRMWVWFEADRLIFKADIVCETPRAFYLEGIYVSPQERGKGYGLRCLSQLSYILLLRTDRLCLLVNRENRQAYTFYQRAGYKLRSYYDTILLRTGS